MDGIRADVDRVLAWDLTRPSTDLAALDVTEGLLDDLTSHARTLAARLDFDYRTLPPTSHAVPTARAVLGEAARRLDLPSPAHPRAMAVRAQNVARLVHALLRADDAVRAQAPHTPHPKGTHQ
ncbi:DUF6415 family natural product biosynthesis protein [Streptomyces sp. NPDC001493]